MRVLGENETALLAKETEDAGAGYATLKACGRTCSPQRRPARRAGAFTKSTRGHRIEQQLSFERDRARRVATVEPATAGQAGAAREQSGQLKSTGVEANDAVVVAAARHAPSKKFVDAATTPRCQLPETALRSAAAAASRRTASINAIG